MYGFRQKQSETDRNWQKCTKNYRNGLKPAEMDKKRNKRTETDTLDRNRQIRTKTHMGQKDEDGYYAE